MSHYKPYPAYKQSGIEWIGEVPNHWEILPFFTVAKELSRSNKGMIESKVLSLSYGRIIPKRESENLGLVPESYETYQIVEPGEIVFRFTDLQNDKNSLRSAQVKERGIITSAYLAAKAANINETYLAWLMRAYDHCKVFYALGGGLRQSLKYSDVKRLPVVVPPLVEQCRSVRLIDRETARIDTLIAKKTQFIELLAKKRQALITHAVSKGLNPNAKMRESGVEWIGEVPEHWNVVQIRHVAILGSGHTPSRSRPDWWENCHIPWFTLADIWQVRREGRRYVFETEETVSDLGIANSSATVHPAGSVMLSRTASVGFPAIMGCDMATSQDFAVWRCGKRLHNEFLYLALLGMKQELSRLMIGSTHKTIYMPDIEAFRMPLPSIDEQKTIVEYVDYETKRIDRLAKLTTTSIDLLKKRRSALITAAVTGQIDLRESA